jgi:SAM-dependent methyltransferase
VSELRARGRRALGLDLSPVAVSITRERGAAAMLGSVFEHVPEAGEWDTALLLDGNLGIGGDPVALLRRVRELLAPGGIVIAELDASGLTARTRVRIESDGAVSEWFPWAHVGCEDVRAVAGQAELAVSWTLHQDGRAFAGLRRP